MTEPLTDIPADALPDDTPAAPEQLAPEADQAGDLTSNSTSDTDVDDQGDGKAGRDAAKYRARLRETETERDQLRDQLNAQRRATVDWRASSKSVDSALLDAAGINIDELVDAETGHVDMPKVDAFIEATADRFKVRRGFEPNRGQGQSGAPAAKPSLSDAFRP
jgi:hypothetical protein